MQKNYKINYVIVYSGHLLTGQLIATRLGHFFELFVSFPQKQSKFHGGYIVIIRN